ncbi:MAG: F0F1 ATP synthase subunit A [Dehalococcoidia bacterium]
MAAIKNMWGRIGKKPRIAIIAVVCIIVVAIGTILFRIPDPPHVVLPPEAIVSLGGEVEEGTAVTGFPITNTMIGAWITIVVLALVCCFATRKMKLVPRGLQNVVEAAMEAMINFVNGVAGEEKGRKFFPMFATIFLFVFANAWLALLPGFGSIGFWETIQEGAEAKEVLVPLFRGANTDVNVPLAIALVSFVFVEYWGLRTLGPRYLKKFVSVGTMFKGVGLLFHGKKAGIGMMLNGFIEAFVGFVEALSEVIRIVSFTFRLFGNMTAGEILLGSMMFLIPWLVATIFYGLELFVGFVQALIFSGLTLVFVTMATTSHDEGHEEHAEHAGQ